MSIWTALATASNQDVVPSRCTGLDGIALEFRPILQAHCPRCEGCGGPCILDDLKALANGPAVPIPLKNYTSKV